eukprot:3189667-Pyramimonas_sp.AAC.1
MPPTIRAFYSGGFEAVMSRREAALILGVRSGHLMSTTLVAFYASRRLGGFKKDPPRSITPDALPLICHVVWMSRSTSFWSP